MNRRSGTRLLATSTHSMYTLASFYDSACAERRGDGAAERAGLENRSPRKGTASSNLAPSAILSCLYPTFSAYGSYC